jgi:hypothetical protein
MIRTGVWKDLEVRKDTEEQEDPKDDRVSTVESYISTPLRFFYTASLENSRIALSAYLQL